MDKWTSGMTFLTEHIDDSGTKWYGPRIEADTRAEAEQILEKLVRDMGYPLDAWVVGELVSEMEYPNGG